MFRFPAIHRRASGVRQAALSRGFFSKGYRLTYDAFVKFLTDIYFEDARRFPEIHFFKISASLWTSVKV